MSPILTKTLFSFITPCFCGGAGQKTAELRAPSIRGELRWWFRVLGGTRLEEAQVFGGIAQDSGPSVLASNLRLRVQTVKQNSNDLDRLTRVPLPKGIPDLGYLLGFYVGRSRGWQNEAALPVGMDFEIQYGWRDPRTMQNNPLLLEKWEKTWSCFSLLGAIGYRSNRCAGAFCRHDSLPTRDQVEQFKKEILLPEKFRFSWIDGSFGNWEDACSAAGNVLRQLRRGRSAKTADTPLGRDKPRQGSAVRFRPLLLQDKRLQVVIYEAPHNRVLGPEVRDTHPVLTSDIYKQQVFPQNRGYRR